MSEKQFPFTVTPLELQGLDAKAYARVETTVNDKRAEIHFDLISLFPRFSPNSDTYQVVVESDNLLVSPKEGMFLGDLETLAQKTGELDSLESKLNVAMSYTHQKAIKVSRLEGHYSAHGSNITEDASGDKIQATIGQIEMEQTKLTRAREDEDIIRGNYEKLQATCTSDEIPAQTEPIRVAYHFDLGKANKRKPTQNTRKPSTKQKKQLKAAKNIIIGRLVLAGATIAATSALLLHKNRYGDKDEQSHQLLQIEANTNLPHYHKIRFPEQLDLPLRIGGEYGASGLRGVDESTLTIPGLVDPKSLRIGDVRSVKDSHEIYLTYQSQGGATAGGYLTIPNIQLNDGKADFTIVYQTTYKPDKQRLISYPQELRETILFARQEERAVQIEYQDKKFKLKRSDDFSTMSANNKHWRKK